MSKRFIVSPDTEYDSGLYHVFDTQRLNMFDQTYCVESYVPLPRAEAIAKEENEKAAKKVETTNNEQ